MLENTTVSMDSVMERFLEDIHECVEAVNKAAATFGKELTHLNVDPVLGRVNVIVRDVHAIH